MARSNPGSSSCSFCFGNGSVDIEWLGCSIVSLVDSLKKPTPHPLVQWAKNKRELGFYRKVKTKPVLAQTTHMSLSLYHLFTRRSRCLDDHSILCHTAMRQEEARSSARHLIVLMARQRGRQAKRGKFYGAPPSDSHGRAPPKLAPRIIRDITF